MTPRGRRRATTHSRTPTQHRWVPTQYRRHTGDLSSPQHHRIRTANMEMKVFKPTNGSSDVFDMLRLRDDRPDTEEANSAAEDETAEATEDGPDDDAAHETPPASRARRLLRRSIVVAAGILFVAALGLSAFLGWQL